MDITGSIALVTGANRGIGRHRATQLLQRGAPLLRHHVLSLSSRRLKDLH